MEFHDSNYRSLAEHTSPRKNVLLLSCMDLRLLDNLVSFMNFENLENRYDQFILAGAAAGATHVSAWNRAFFDHLLLAVALHEIKYVYIIEHRDCGAYEEFLGKSYVEYDEDLGRNCYHRDEEREDHRRQAFQLRDQINAYCHARRKDLWPPGDQPGEKAFRNVITRSHGQEPDAGFLKKLWKIEVRCFLMDLRGSVEWLDQDTELLDHARPTVKADRPTGRVTKARKPTRRPPRVP